MDLTNSPWVVRVILIASVKPGLRVEVATVIVQLLKATPNLLPLEQRAVKLCDKHRYVTMEANMAKIFCLKRTCDCHTL